MTDGDAFGDAISIDPKRFPMGYRLRVPKERIFQIDDLQIDLDRQQVERAGVRLEVAGLSFRLLAYLLEQGNRVVGFDELIDAVWAPAIVGEETVTQRIKLLRQAFGDEAVALGISVRSAARAISCAARRGLWRRRPTNPPHARGPAQSLRLG